MDKLIELLQQIQELAGVGVDALKGASGGDKGGPPEHGAGGPPHGGGYHGGPPHGGGDGSGPPEGGEHEQPPPGQ